MSIVDIEYYIQRLSYTCAVDILLWNESDLGRYYICINFDTPYEHFYYAYKNKISCKRYYVFIRLSDYLLPVTNVHMYLIL